MHHRGEGELSKSRHHRVHKEVEMKKKGAVYLPSQLERTLYVMVDRVEGGGRASPTLTSEC
jgi:hypothetical protein